LTFPPILNVPGMEEQKKDSSKDSLHVNVDQYLGYIGEFGKRQIILQVLFCLMIIPATYQSLLLTFVANSPAWKCTGLTHECNETGTAFTVSNDFYSKRCEFNNRSSWEFIQPKKFSIVTEWGLVCEKNALSYLANSALFIGWAIGALILMAVADRYGRKSVLFPSLAVILICGFVSGFVQNFWLFFVLRLITGFGQGGVGLSIYVLATELVGPHYRALSGTIIWFAFTLALCLVALKAWLVPDWRLLEIIVSAPYLFVLIFWKFVPESIRWLRVNDRLEDAEKILNDTARMNGKPMPNVKLAAANQQHAQGTYADLFRPWPMCRDTLIQNYTWFVNGMVYYGVSLASDNLGGNMYRDFVLTSLVEIPANVLVIVLGNKLGRKPTSIWSMFIGGLSCGLVAAIPNNKVVAVYMWSRVLLGMMGKLCITLSFNEIYIWSVELNPTIVRSQGMGLLQVISRIGAASAPWVAQFLRHVDERLPFILMGGLTILAGFLCFKLNETNGKETAEVFSNMRVVEEVDLVIVKSPKDGDVFANVREDEIHGGSEKSFIDSSDSENAQLAKKV